MEHYKISKLLNDLTVSKFVKRKRIKVNFLWSGEYSVYKNVRFKTLMSWSNLYDYSDEYIVEKRKRTVEAETDDKRRIQKLIFKHNALFRSWIS